MNRIKSRAAGLVLALCGFGLTVGSAQAAPMTVTSLDGFNTAIGAAPVTSDSFSNNIAGGLEITFGSGVVSTMAGGNLGGVEFNNQVRVGSFSGGLDGDGSIAPLTWTFPVPVIGFIADFGLIRFLDVTIPGSDVFFDINTAMGGFSGKFGLIDSQTPFTQIQFSIQNSSRRGGFIIDNLRFAAVPSVAAVPEPGTLALFGLGLAGFALARRSSKGRGQQER